MRRFAFYAIGALFATTTLAIETVTETETMTLNEVETLIGCTIADVEDEIKKGTHAVIDNKYTKAVASNIKGASEILEGVNLAVDPIMDAVTALKEGKGVGEVLINGLRAVCNKIKEQDKATPHSCWLKSQGRGMGKPMNKCPKGKEKSGLLCYNKCKRGYTGIGLACWMDCPASMQD